MCTKCRTRECNENEEEFPGGIVTRKNQILPYLYGSTQIQGYALTIRLGPGIHAHRLTTQLAFNYMPEIQRTAKTSPGFSASRVVAGLEKAYIPH